jgi:tetratricopeptide (TPR) repeat protein
MSTTRAWQLKDRASDREKFFIAATYEILATGNLEQARQICEAWAHTYPREALPHVMLSGNPNKAAGRYEQAIAEARKAIELDPDFAMAYFNFGVNNVYLNRPEEAENALRRAVGRGLDIDEFSMLRHDIAFLKGDLVGMEREASRARERSGAEAWISNKGAFVLAYSGHLQQARTLSQRAVDQATQEHQSERAALWQAGEALREAFFEQSPEAKKRAAAALKLSNSREVEYGAALTFALTGDSSRAQTLADDLERRFPEDTVVRFSYLPVLRARIALNRGDGATAIEILQAATPYELGASRGLFGALYPIYVRGQAYLAEHQGTEAASEFQNILDHRGIVGSDPIGALAHLQLGRALALLGDTIKAKSAYQDFLTVWKDADPSIPTLSQARSEYAKLQ